MRFKLIGFYLIVVLFMLVGCKAGKGGSTQYNFFYSPADHLSELVTQQKWNDASEVYNANEAWFTEKGADPAIQSQLQSVASWLEAKHRTSIVTDTNVLGALQWPVASSQWKESKDTIESLSSNLKQLESVKLFTIA